jgi:hypothetical protein
MIFERRKPMQAKASGKQTIWVLLISLMLIMLCIGGLWAYVQNADAETGITETSLADIPEEYKTAFIKEKYENYPLLFYSANDYWYQGKALHKSEIPRLHDLMKAYEGGERPSAKASSLPGDGPFAIIPLDPKEFSGMAEYYILPEDELTDNQLLMLIDYGEEKGVPFTEDTLTTMNCMRGNTASNRFLSAGESERLDILLHRISMEGLQASSLDLSPKSLPVSGVSIITLNPRIFLTDMFYLYPTRELTDEELLQIMYQSYQSNMDGYSYLNPLKPEGQDAAGDTAKIRSFLEDVLGMPMATECVRLSYKQKSSTGEIHAMACFKTALISGRDTRYTVYMDKAGGNILYASTNTYNLETGYGTAADLLLPEADLLDPRWADLANKTVSILTKEPIASAKAVAVNASGIDGEPGVQIEVYLKNGGTYVVQILLSTGKTAYVRYWDQQLGDDTVW